MAMCRSSAIAGFGCDKLKCLAGGGNELSSLERDETGPL